MKKQYKYLWGKKFILFLFFIFLVMLTLFIADEYFDLKKDIETYSIDIEFMINQKMDLIVNEIDFLPRTASNDILFLSKISSLKKYLSTQSKKDLDILRNDFFEFSLQNNVYAQLRYIDKDGLEKVRINFDGVNYENVQEINLQDKSDRYYFLEASKIFEDEIYISRLDLNIEREIIENIGDKENPIYVPMIRYSTPVFDNEKRFRGLIVGNIYGEYFLEDIRRLQKDKETIFFIDNGGYYLVHYNRSKEFGFMFDKNDSFALDYPEIYKFLIDNPNERIYETDESVVFFRHIYPTLGSFEIYKVSEKIFGEDIESHYHWIFIDILKKK